MLKRLSEDELKAIIADYEAAVESASAETVRKMRRFLKQYVANFKALLLDVNASESAKIDLAEQERIVRSIRELLDESGYREVVDEFDQSLATVGAESLKYFQQYFDETITISGAPKELLDAMADNFVAELDFQMDARLVRPLESAVRNSILALETRQQQVAEIARIIDREEIVRRDGKEFTQANIEVLAYEGPRRFGQQVRNEQATELGLEVFIYTGPDDSRTSEQCQFLLREARHGAPGFWYRDELKAGMHPGLKENPLVARGHYNCRHTWMPTDEAGAQRIDPSFQPRGEDGRAD